MGDLCPQSKMMEQTHSCDAVGKNGPISIGTSPLPEVLRGVFWLAEQGDSSALMSFAKSKDGKGLSQGALEPKPSDGFQYKIRVGGDKVWSFHDKATSWGLVEILDLVYKFAFDDTTNPTEAQIIPSGENLHGFDVNAPWLLDFKMSLLPKGSHKVYKNSTVWARPSKVLGIEGGYYDLIQVMDEHGHPLEPAFSDWRAYCKSAETGGTPNVLHYRKAVDGCPEVETVGSAQFDLTEWVRKTWYIQAQQVTGYQPKSALHCVAATYNLEGKSVPFFGGSVASVYNYANLEKVNGANQNPENTILCARSNDDDDTSRLAVAPCFLPNLFAGPYWVLAIGKESNSDAYSWAIVIGGQPTERYADGCTTKESGINESGLWLFSRAPVASEETMAAMYQALKDRGIARSRLVPVPQEGCEYEGAFIK